MRARFVGLMVGPHASCTDCCIVPYRSYLHGSGGGGGCSCMLLSHPIPRLALMLAPTFAPGVLTFGPGACGVFLLPTGTYIPLAQVVVVTSCNLHWWSFFIQHYCR